MAQSAPEFEWEVAAAGYQQIKEPVFWAAPEGAMPGPYITERWPGEASGLRARVYQPLLEFPGLFMAFVLLGDPKADRQSEFLRFAEQFGLLGLLSPDARLVIVPHPNRPDQTTPAWAEPIASWIFESVALARAILLWKGIQSGDNSLLARWIEWTKDGRTILYRGFLNDSIEVIPQTLGRIVPGDLIQPAIYFVRNLVNDKLEKHAVPALGFAGDDARLRLRVAPRNLLGAMWLQFARMIDENKLARRCSECGKWFLVSADTKPGYKLFDSDACRAAAYRRRKEARRLAADGALIEDIAARLGRDIETVTTWLNHDEEAEEHAPPKKARRGTGKALKGGEDRAPGSQTHSSVPTGRHGKKP